MANYTEGTPMQKEVEVYSVTQTPFGDRGGKVTAVTTSEGLELKTYEKAMGDWFNDKKYTNPVQITYAMRTSQGRDGKEYVNAIIKEAEGFERPTKSYGGGGGGYSKSDPVVDNRSYALRYVTDIIVAGMAAGSMKVDTTTMTKLPPVMIAVAKQLSDWVVTGTEPTVIQNPQVPQASVVPTKTAKEVADETAARIKQQFGGDTRKRGVTTTTPFIDFNETGNEDVPPLPDGEPF